MTQKFLTKADAAAIHTKARARMTEALEALPGELAQLVAGRSAAEIEAISQAHINAMFDRLEAEAIAEIEAAAINPLED